MEGTELKCDANCDPCEGEVKEVLVSSDDGRWDNVSFNYCEAAIRHDEAQGFKIKIAPPAPSRPQ